MGQTREAGDATATFSRIKNGSLVPLIADQLRAAIFGGTLRPGDPLVEMRLARDFGVSQASVREALIQLEQAGLVVRAANKGTTVTILSDEAIKERIRVRGVLEGLACVDAAPLMDAEDYAELDRRVAAITSAASRDAYYEAAQADLNFHRYIWHKTGNKTLYHTLDQITAPLFAFVSILRSSDHEVLNRVISKHQKIISALRKGDPERILEIMRQHVTTSYERYLHPQTIGAPVTGRVERPAPARKRKAPAHRRIS